MHRPRTPRDAGFSLTELLVVMIVVGILGGIAVPVFRAQQRDALDRTVSADLMRYATAAERLFSATSAYPTSPIGFDIRDRGNPAASPGNTVRAFTIGDGADSGYVLYGQNSTTGTVWSLSSFTGGQPTRTSLSALPEAPPMTGSQGVPTSVVAASWSSLAGMSWGAVTAADPAASPVVPFYDPTLLLATVGGTAANAQAYDGASHRVVSFASPVAARAIEISTLSANQGVILLQQPPAASWPGASPITGANETWTVSVWVMAPAGSAMEFGPRITASDGSYVTEGGYSFSATGDWQRASFTITLGAAVIGKYVGVEVYSAAAGVTFDVTCAQVNIGSVATPFSLG